MISILIHSTYAFSENKITRHVELEGLETAPFEYMHGRRLTDNEKVVANRLKAGVQNVIIGAFSFFNAISDDHRAGNVTDPVKRQEILDSRNYWIAQSIINYGSGFITGKIVNGIKPGLLDASASKLS